MSAGSLSFNVEPPLHWTPPSSFTSNVNRAPRTVPVRCTMNRSGAWTPPPQPAVMVVAATAATAAARLLRIIRPPRPRPHGPGHALVPHGGSRAHRDAAPARIAGAGQPVSAALNGLNPAKE